MGPLPFFILIRASRIDKLASFGFARANDNEQPRGDVL